MISAYDPLRPAKSPGGRPADAPVYRVLVHKNFRRHYEQLVARVGIQQARQFWEHLSLSPGEPSGIANIVILRGRAGRPMGEGWSRTHHYEITSMARADYQYNDHFVTQQGTDAHRVVAILTLSYGSH